MEEQTKTQKSLDLRSAPGVVQFQPVSATSLRREKFIFVAQGATNIVRKCLSGTQGGSPPCGQIFDPTQASFGCWQLKR